LFGVSVLQSASPCDCVDLGEGTVAVLGGRVPFFRVVGAQRRLRGHGPGTWDPDEGVVNGSERPRSIFRVLDVQRELQRRDGQGVRFRRGSGRGLGRQAFDSFGCSRPDEGWGAAMLAARSQPPFLGGPGHAAGCVASKRAAAGPSTCSCLFNRCPNVSNVGTCRNPKR
jgi:hypothetical protein